VTLGCLPACAETRIEDIEKAFRALTSRPDIGILLINQSVRAPRPPVLLSAACVLRGWWLTGARCAGG
jgi:hypothetical protein